MLDPLSVGQELPQAGFQFRQVGGVTAKMAGVGANEFLQGQDWPPALTFVFGADAEEHGRRRAGCASRPRSQDGGPRYQRPSC